MDSNNQPQNNPILIEEIQIFRHWLLWTIILVIFTPLLGILFYQFFTGNPVGNNPASNGVLLAIILIYYVPMITLMLYAKLTVRIGNEAIYYGWNIPNNELNKIDWKEVDSIDIITYRFTGYGYRLTKKYGIVYNTKGNKGLQIVKKSGEKILLGTLKPEELKSALQNLNKFAYSKHIS